MYWFIRFACPALVLGLVLSVPSAVGAKTSSSAWSVFVPDAPENDWRVQSFRVTGWGPDPQDHIPGNSKMWGRTLRIESRDFALVSTRRLSRQIRNEAAPYWPASSFMWFRSGETEEPHTISVSCREENAAEPEELGVQPYGAYYTSRLAPERVACRMLGRAGERGTPANMPSFYSWPKIQVTWDYLLDAHTKTALLRVTAKNATDRKLTDVDLNVSFYLGPEFGDIKLRGKTEPNWVSADGSTGDFTALAVRAEGMHSGIAVTAADGGVVDLTSGPKHGRTATVHFRSASLEPGRTAVGRVLVQALLGDSVALPDTVKVPDFDFNSVRYVAQPSPLRYANGSTPPKPHKFLLKQWLADLNRPKVRGVTQVDNSEAVYKQWVNKYSEAHQNLIIAGVNPQNSKDYIDYAREHGIQHVWANGEADGFKELPQESQPEGFGEDNDAPVWSNLANPSRSEDPSLFPQEFGHDITKADREELARCYSRQFADYWRRFESRTKAAVPSAITWFYGQLSYQADRYPLNTDEICRVYCEELAKVPDIHLLYFYYGTDNSHIENQVRIAKSAGLRHVYFMPMSYFCARPGDITGNLAAAWAGGADGAFLFTADWAQDWQFAEWSLASQTYFPTPDLPAFLLTRDLQGLVRAISTASDVRVVYQKGLSPTCDQAVDALRLMLAKRANPDRAGEGKVITIHVGTPDGLTGAAQAKARSVLSACSSAGLPDDRGYVLPFSNDTWVGGATPEACERALGLSLDLARMASFGDECVTFKQQEADRVYYP